jgi:hypothetical protein
MTGELTSPRVVFLRQRAEANFSITGNPRPDYWEVDPALPLGLVLGDHGKVTGKPVVVGVTSHTVTARWKPSTNSPERGNLKYVASLRIAVEAVDEPPTAPPHTPRVSGVVEFFDFDTPCPTPGCEQLRLLYKADVAKTEGGCNSCAAASIKRKYLDAYRNLLRQSS